MAPPTRNTRRTKNSSTPLLHGLDDPVLKGRTRRSRATVQAAGVKKPIKKQKVGKTATATSTKPSTHSASSAAAAVAIEKESTVSNDVTEQSGDEDLGPPLARAVDTVDIIYKGNAAQLTSTLTLRQELASQITCLSYRLEMQLDHIVHDEPQSDAAGYIDAWRIDKATEAHSNEAATAGWLDQLVKPRFQDVPKELEELSTCMRVLYTSKGTVRQKMSSEVRDALTRRSLMYIEMVHVYDAFARQGLLTTALESFYRLLSQLPEWYAFSGSIVLVPGRPDKDQGKAWGNLGDAEVHKKLKQVYESLGFARWNAEAVNGHRHLVMGRVI